MKERANNARSAWEIDFKSSNPKRGLSGTKTSLPFGLRQGF